MSKKGITERESYLALAYFEGRANGRGWDTIADRFPDELHPDCKDMYDRGVEDYSEEGDL
jgi:hypothetical protein